MDRKPVDISSIDIRLLVAFDAVMIEGSISRAARRLGVTQSAVSQSIGKLRDLAGDGLFERTGHGVKPTPRAISIAGPVSQALRILGAAFNTRAEFDPANSNRRFQIAMYPPLAPFLAPKLYAALPRESGVSFNVMGRAPADVEAGMRFGMPEIVLLPRFIHGASIKAELMWEDELVVLARRGHPQLQNGLTEAVYLQLEHVILTRTEGVDDAPNMDPIFEQRGVKRRIPIAVPVASIAYDLVASTDLVMTAHSRYIRLFGSDLPLDVYKLPFAWPRHATYLSWHERFDDDLAHRWMREKLTELCRDM